MSLHNLTRSLLIWSPRAAKPQSWRLASPLSLSALVLLAAAEEALEPRQLLLVMLVTPRKKRRRRSHHRRTLEAVVACLMRIIRLQSSIFYLDIIHAAH